MSTTNFARFKNLWKWAFSARFSCRHSSATVGKKCFWDCRGLCVAFTKVSTADPPVWKSGFYITQWHQQDPGSLHFSYSIIFSIVLRLKVFNEFFFHPHIDNCCPVNPHIPSIPSALISTVGTSENSKTGNKLVFSGPKEPPSFALQSQKPRFSVMELC